MIRLYTIGFTGKTAEKFFSLLRDSDVKKIVDTRINNVSQLSGFAKGADLKFFAKELGDKIICDFRKYFISYEFFIQTKR